MRAGARIDPRACEVMGTEYSRIPGVSDSGVIETEKIQQFEILWLITRVN